ncbi:NRDE family protein [Nibrella viscosa]|uniref:NRDE family protein n=1 Tax=Nibrella viscosa TaxID=1084524 RepID=A0ABP8KUZ0_9BACT
MCTVTYLPLSDNGFMLTSSRDEQVSRPSAASPRTERIGGREVCFPQDPQGRGTWIAASGRSTLCLLNGAFRAHVPQPPYRHSRGLVVLDFFQYTSLYEFLEDYAFTGIEPFTLLVVEAGLLVELRWDGARLHYTEPDPAQAHIWSSATLYSADVVARREAWFRAWLQTRTTYSLGAIRNFHKTAGAGDPENGLFMNRDNRIRTVSLTSVLNLSYGTELFYEDFSAPSFTHQLIANYYHERIHDN